MTLSDLPQVMVIEQVSFSAPWSARAYRYEITENSHRIMLVVRSQSGSRGGFSRWLSRLKLAQAAPVLGYAGFWLLVDDAHIATIARSQTGRPEGHARSPRFQPGGSQPVPQTRIRDRVAAQPLLC